MGRLFNSQPIQSVVARAGPPYPTIFIGTDAPDLRSGHPRAAADALACTRAVIGPAEDGGYWLLGLARPVAGVFDGVDWGTGAMFAQTLARLRGARLLFGDHAMFFWREQFLAVGGFDPGSARRSARR